ncbi:MAG TPA: hypothetical protein VL225_05275 [Vicinamibacterales bacterium]|jgi:hypothetical protein|nr:hypothetical protein [Vicinamibacterales bacterium]
MTKRMLAGVFIALAALVGLDSTGVSAQQASQSWSVAVHIRYPDGFIYDHAFATGVPTSELPSILEECGRAHMGGSAVQYHCYAIPE